MWTCEEWNVSTWYIVSYRNWLWDSLKSHTLPLSLEAPTQLEQPLFCNELCASYFRVFVHVLPTFFCLNIPQPNSLGCNIFLFWGMFSSISHSKNNRENGSRTLLLHGRLEEQWVVLGKTRWVAKGLLLLFVDVMFCSSQYLVTYLYWSYFSARNVVFVFDGL